MATKIALLSTVLLGACSVIGVRSGTEEPAYRVIAHQGLAEIRQYGPRVAAETTVDTQNEIDARSIGFRRLAGYIFGGNSAKAGIAMTAPVGQTTGTKPGEKTAGETTAGERTAGETIAMTAPVAQDRTAAGWTIRFFMPAKYTLDTLPKPSDPSVRLVPVPSQIMAVIRFTGSTSPDAVANHQAELMTALANGPWRPDGALVAWFYDPPWTIPFLRRNEVAVPVQRAG